jgi:uncharacterized RmlC-like cupin family protein
VSGVRLIRADERTAEATPTPGMNRQEAIASERLWAGFVTSARGATSGWHHHGEYETAIYVLAGRFLMEFGPGGGESFEAEPGDFIHVPPGAIHRERNPSDVELQAVVVRAGSGPPTVNVNGPEG